MVIWYGILSSGLTYNTSSFIYFTEHLLSTRGSDLADGYALKNQLECITEEVIKLRQDNKEQQKTMNRDQHLLGQLCSFWKLTSEIIHCN